MWQNFEIEKNRLIYHYKLNAKTTIKCKIPYKEEVFPLLQNIHIKSFF